MTLSIVPTAVQPSVAEGLRVLAAEIEAGKYGDVKNFVWVIENETEYEVGQVGNAVDPQGRAALMLLRGLNTVAA